MVIFTIIIIFAESLKVFFLIKDKDQFFYFNFQIRYVTIFIFTLDITKNFFTLYYKKGNLISNHSEIFKNYLTGHFIFDIISLFGFITSSSQYLIQQQEIFTNWSRILFFLKIFSVKLYFIRLESAFIIQDSFKHWIRLGKLLFVIIFTCHFCACLFYGIGKAEYFYLGIENTWLNIDNNNLL